jgi:1-acyl-sn-glycerol-3-phosphate acyltransferase
VELSSPAIFTPMFYWFVKNWVGLGFHFFAKKIRIINSQALYHKGPLLLACNHPNSFFDAMLVGRFMKEPTYYMTRGDVFKKAWVRRIFNSLKMIPIFRIRDGKEKLGQNEETFIKSVDALRKNELLLIFVEGFCEHQTELQVPLKKGAARILQSCWQEGIPAKVLPVWLEYSSFDRFGKTMDIRFGELFGSEVSADISSATCINEINAETTTRLLKLSRDIPFKPEEPGILLRILLFIPAMLGAVLHAPLYLPVQKLVSRLSRDNVHYDSMLFAFLIFTYPLYLLLLTSVLLVITHQWWPLLVLVLFPLTAKAYLHWKK